MQDWQRASPSCAQVCPSRLPLCACVCVCASACAPAAMRDKTESGVLGGALAR